MSCSTRPCSMCTSTQPVRLSSAWMRLPPARGLVAGGLGGVPERDAVLVADRLAQLLLAHALEHDPRAEQHLPEARALLLEERDQPQRQPLARLAPPAGRPRAPCRRRACRRTCRRCGWSRSANRRRRPGHPEPRWRRSACRPGPARRRSRCASSSRREVGERVAVDVGVGVAADRAVAERVTPGLRGSRYRARCELAIAPGRCVPPRLPPIVGRLRRLYAAAGSRRSPAPSAASPEGRDAARGPRRRSCSPPQSVLGAFP